MTVTNCLFEIPVCHASAYILNLVIFAFIYLTSVYVICSILTQIVVGRFSNFSYPSTLVQQGIYGVGKVTVTSVATVLYSHIVLSHSPLNLSCYITAPDMTHRLLTAALTFCLL